MLVMFNIKLERPYEHKHIITPQHSRSRVCVSANTHTDTHTHTHTDTHTHTHLCRSSQ
jgi:hypothetical protein